MVLPRKRGRIFRQLLRFLPARSLRSRCGHLHRKRIHHQRRTRQTAYERHPLLFERHDVIVVASVTCIYGIGSPEAYFGMLVMLEKGYQTSREALLRRFVDIQYERSEDLRRGTFRVRGDILGNLSDLRRQRLSHRNVGRSDRQTSPDRSADRGNPRRPGRHRAHAHLSENTLRHAAASATVPSSAFRTNLTGGRRS